MSHINILTLRELKENNHLISHLQSINALPKEIACRKCKSKMKLQPHQDSHRWVCGAIIKKPKKCPQRCTYTQTLTSRTFFHGSKLSLESICFFVELWTKNAPLNLIKHETGITNQNTLVDWANFCREVVFESMVTNAEPMGGEGRTIEIDESKFGRRKYNRGKRVEGQWVFGLLERETGKVMLVPVETRDRATLLPIIRKYVRPDSIIISDLWKAYNTLGDEGYTHLTVNHSLTFKDPETGANTNRIESTWRAAKASYNSSGRRKKFFAGYLAKYLFMKKCRMMREDPFVSFFKAAGELFNGVNEIFVGRDENHTSESEEEGDSENDFF